MNYRDLDPDCGKALRAEQAKHNDGRGSVTAREVATHLERGDNQSAYTVWCLDRDKVRQYPLLMHYMNRLFGTDFV